MSRGFTLIELLFTLVVAALVLTLAAPSFQSAVNNSAMTTGTNNLIASLQLARSEALKRRLPVTICTTSDFSAATPSCADTDWQQGWMVFADDNGDGQFDTGETVLHGERTMRRSVRVTLPAGQPLQTALTYLPSGFPNLGGLNAAGVMLLCDDRQSDQFGRVIVISQTGRPQATSLIDRPDLGVTCE